MKGLRGFCEGSSILVQNILLTLLLLLFIVFKEHCYIVSFVNHQLLLKVKKQENWI